MFDKYTTVEYGGPSKVTIEEKRAPTDDSIRLWEEMRKKMLDEILSSHRVSNNVLDGVVLCRRMNYGLGNELVIHYELNGNKYTLKQDISMMELQIWDQNKAIESLMNSLSRHIAMELTRKIMVEIGK